MKRMLVSAALCLLLVQVVAAQEKPFLENLPYYVENLSVFERGQEPGRAFHIPEQNLSLNGTWKFQYYETPLDVPGDFFQPSFNDRK